VLVLARNAAVRLACAGLPAPSRRGSPDDVERSAGGAAGVTGRLCGAVEAERGDPGEVATNDFRATVVPFLKRIA
jgi:hypothetical protein